MATCNFCEHKFQSSQGVRAHLRWCEKYHLSRKKTGVDALGTMPRQMMPKAGTTPAATPPVQTRPPVAAPDLATPWRECITSMGTLSTKQNAPQTPQQQRRKILQATKTQVIDHYWTPLGEVTPALRGAAKSAIERELATLPFEELPFEEVCELAVTIREQCYLPIFKRQAEEAEHQKAEHEARRRKETETAAAAHREERRKTMLIEQAIDQARAICEAKSIVGWNRLGLLATIELRLHEFLTGHESVPEAHAIIQIVLDARFAEADAKHEAAQAKQEDKWREDMTVLGVLAGLIILAFKFPAYTWAILSWIQQTFGPKPSAEAGSPTHNASEATKPAASAESRPPSKRRRKYPVAPFGSVPSKEDTVVRAPALASHTPTEPPEPSRPAMSGGS